MKLDLRFGFEMVSLTEDLVGDIDVAAAAVLKIMVKIRLNMLPLHHREGWEIIFSQSLQCEFFQLLTASYGGASRKPL
jgi:hypothetical protein